MGWHLSEASAIGAVGTSQIEVAPSAPAQGARWRLANPQAAQPAAAPQVAAAWQIAAIGPLTGHSGKPLEVYGRQGDLIVRYGQGPTDQFSYQLDWRLLQSSAPFAAAIELWLSVQTNLLDTQPELEIACTAPAGTCWSIFEHQQLATDTQLSDAARGPAALLCGLPADADLDAGADHAVAQGLWLIEPTDQCHARLCTAVDQAEQRVRLFGHFMEKGVIRRARMRFLLADAQHLQAAITPAQVIAAYRDFAESPLPLTA